MNNRVVLAVAAAAWLLAVAPPAGAATFTVTNTNNSGAGSLRQALLNSNATSGKDTVKFNIPGSGLHVIAPSQTLPATTDPVVIDATTQPGYSGVPLIQLKGNGQQNEIGLNVQGGGSTVRGLDIVGWGGGIELTKGNGNTVASNIIGADQTGRVGMPNFVGVAVVGSSNNTIGGTTTAARNLISGNDGRGVLLTNAPQGFIQTGQSENKNTILGNYIGTTLGGSGALANAYGIWIENAASGNVIGTTTAGNVISGNSSDGIMLYGDADPSQHPLGTSIVNNMVGVNPAGGGALSNGSRGIEIDQSDHTAIGGVPVGTSNVISGNGFDGISIYGSQFTSIANNTIGTNAAQTGAIPNGANGVEVNGASGNTRIGGFTSGTTIIGAPNLISGNANDGVRIQDSNGNSVLSNQIGTNGAGTAAIANTGNGVEIVSSAVQVQNNKIGQVDAGNVISGNGADGVYIDGSANRAVGGAGAISNPVVGNEIGTNAAGTGQLANGQNGVETKRGDFNSVTDNVISGNKVDGVFLGFSNGNTLLNNQIGLAGSFGNGADGVYISASNSTQIKLNTIVKNGGDGVDEPGGLFDWITDNSIYSNGGLGIDLNSNGVTPNDANDADVGANTLLNFPTLTNSTIQNGNVTINGTYDGAVSKTFTVELYASTACDPSGFGEGKTFLGTKVVTTNASGHASFSATFPLPYSSPRLSATAYDGKGNTSEFSNCIQAG
jgi:parallel beta-helix repeat protein